MSLDNSNVSKHLGKNSEYIKLYDPTLLVREPRKSNRIHLDIDDNNPPFVGNDTWNAYEITALTDNGLPVAGIAKIVYPATNAYIVESKSLKLYFGSFSMTKLGKDRAEVFRKLCDLASKDLSELLETEVLVAIFSNSDCLYIQEPSEEWEHNDFITLEDTVNLTNLVFDKYNEAPELLDIVDADSTKEYAYHSALLRSNCRVTAQPDSGDVYILLDGDKTVTPESLLKYIVSFRDECHFHEEICETIYQRLNTLLKPNQLMVRCLYARRGGIDINPERASHDHLLHQNLSLVIAQHTKTPKQ